MDKTEAWLKADRKVIIDKEAPGKTGLIIGLIIGLIGGIGIGLYIYKKKNEEDEQPEGGSDDGYQAFVDHNIQNWMNRVWK